MIDTDRLPAVILVAVLVALLCGTGAYLYAHARSTSKEEAQAAYNVAYGSAKRHAQKQRVDGAFARGIQIGERRGRRLGAERAAAIVERQREELDLARAKEAQQRTLRQLRRRAKQQQARRTAPVAPVLVVPQKGQGPVEGVQGTGNPSGGPPNTNQVGSDPAKQEGQ